MRTALPNRYSAKLDGGRPTTDERRRTRTGARAHETGGMAGERASDTTYTSPQNFSKQKDHYKLIHKAWDSRPCNFNKQKGAEYIPEIWWQGHLRRILDYVERVR